MMESFDSVPTKSTEDAMHSDAEKQQIMQQMIERMRKLREERDRPTTLQGRKDALNEEIDEILDHYMVIEQSMKK